MSIMEQFLAAGITPRIVPEMSLQDGIEAARLVLPKCWFDEGATYDGIEHLRGYMREWDERTQMYRSRPKHDQHSHAADAFRYMALSTKKVSGVSSGFEVKKKVSAGASYSFSLDDVWDCAPQAINRIG
jgi:phage terminase large subunit